MKNNLKTTRILCFGDSNTWGRSGASVDRYPVDKRWTGILQEKLGNEFKILEEGLRSRTTNLEDDDPLIPGRNGKKYLEPCLESQYPTDIVVLWLGTNDLKSKFNREAKDVVKAMAELIETIKSRGMNISNQPPKIILISSPLVKEEMLGKDTQFAGAGKKSEKFAEYFEQVASDNQCTFIDLAKHVLAGNHDGIHLELEMQSIVAEVIYKKVVDL